MKYTKFGALILLISILTFAQKTYTIKMATVAPEGSAWMEEMHQFEKDIAKLSNNQIAFHNTFYNISNNIILTFNIISTFNGITRILQRFRYKICINIRKFV